VLVEPVVGVVGRPHLDDVEPEVGQQRDLQVRGEDRRGDRDPVAFPDQPVLLQRAACSS
jgi:hypothetical protein